MKEIAPISRLCLNNFVLAFDDPIWVNLSHIVEMGYERYIISETESHKTTRTVLRIQLVTGKEYYIDMNHTDLLHSAN